MMDYVRAVELIRSIRDRRSGKYPKATFDIGEYTASLFIYPSQDGETEVYEDSFTVYIPANGKGSIAEGIKRLDSLLEEAAS